MNKLAKDTHELQIDMRTMADRLERRARRVRMVRPNDSIAYEWCTAADTLRRQRPPGRGPQEPAQPPVPHLPRAESTDARRQGAGVPVR